MHRKTMFGAMLAAALLSAAMLGSAWAQASTQTLQITPSRDSGVSGTATLTDTGAGLEVQLDVQGIPSAEGTEHIAHIHEGATCADDRAGQGAPVEFPLNSVFNEGGAGSSTSTIEDSLDELSGDVPHYIAVHAEVSGEGTPPSSPAPTLPILPWCRAPAVRSPRWTRCSSAARSSRRWGSRQPASSRGDAPKRRI